MYKLEKNTYICFAYICLDVYILHTQIYIYIERNMTGKLVNKAEIK